MSAGYFDKLGPPIRINIKAGSHWDTDPYLAPEADFSLEIGNFSSKCFPDMFSLSQFSADDMRPNKCLEACN